MAKLHLIIVLFSGQAAFDNCFKKFAIYNPSGNRAVSTIIYFTLALLEFYLFIMKGKDFHTLNEYEFLD